LFRNLRFLNNFPLKILEFAASYGKFRETCERTGRFLNKPEEIFEQFEIKSMVEKRLKNMIPGIMFHGKTSGKKHEF
jgi:hypothetical protein